MVAHCLEDHLEDMSKQQLEDFLAEQQIPTVIGPDAPEGFYITDKHHLLYALFSASFDSFKHPMQHRTMYLSKDSLVLPWLPNVMQMCAHLFIGAEREGACGNGND